MRFSAPSIVASLGLALAIAACGSGTTTAATTVAGSSTYGGPTTYPLTITNCGVATTYTKSPTKMVTNDINMTEIALDLGLSTKMVGIAGISDPSTVRSDLTAAYNSVKVLSPDYVTLEPLLGANPDFFFAGWNYGLDNSNGLTPQALKAKGIDTYAITESCAQVETKGPATIDETYTDIENIGAIFDVQAKAKAILDGMKSDVAAVQAKVKGLPIVNTFVYDSGEDAPFTAPALAIPNEMITTAGGKDIFDDLKKSWTTVSWEDVVAKDPACVVIVDYGDTMWQQKRDYMRNTPALKNITAVKNDCFLALPYSEMVPGIRDADAVQAIAKLLHPDAFK